MATSSRSSGPGPAGIDPGPVSRWMARHVEDLEPPFTFELLAGGHSNLTFRVIDARRRSCVLRRPPLAEVLASAHDMGREHRVMAALAGSEVPVPRMLGRCDDPAVNGSPFYVMSFVEGTVFNGQAELCRALGPQEAARAAHQLVDALAALHTVAPDDVGLGDFARPDGYVERQLRRWLRQYESTADPPHPLVREVHDRLVRAVPPQRSSAIVHGDFRLGNTVVAADGSLAAVLDWELATLGDPLADLGWLVVTWRRSADDARPPGTEEPLGPGFLDEDQAVERYAARVRTPLPDLDYYLAFTYWRWTCIMQGVEHRYRSGAMGTPPAGGTPDFSAMAAWQLERAAALAPPG